LINQTGAETRTPLKPNASRNKVTKHSLLKLSGKCADREVKNDVEVPSAKHTRGAIRQRAVAQALGSALPPMLN
jgi:hypothetical protein